MLIFVARLDEAFGKIFAGPETMRRCTNDLKELLKKDNNQVKIHWLWNRVIIMLLALMVIISTLMAEQLMRSPLVLGLRKSFFRYPWKPTRLPNVEREVPADGMAVGVCSQLFPALLVTSLFTAWLLALLAEGKRVLVGPKLPWYPPNCLKTPIQFLSTRPTCSGSWCTNALRLAFCIFLDYAWTFCIILATWWAFAVGISGELTQSGRVPNYMR